MKNRICRTCCKQFHFCASCDCPGDWEDLFCSYDCFNFDRFAKKTLSFTQVISRALRFTLESVFGFPGQTTQLIKESLFDSTSDDSGQYDNEFGDDKICKCAHRYVDHFDEHDCQKSLKCNNCDCTTFTERS